MKTFEVHVTYKGTAVYSITAKREEDIDQIVHDDLMGGIISIQDVKDRSDYEVESFEKEQHEDEDDDEPVIYDCQDGR